jgi:hypothetical protein
MVSGKSFDHVVARDARSVVGRHGAGLSRLAAAVLLVVCAVATPARAQGCRVPEVYLKLSSSLPLTAKLVDRGNEPLRILVIGPKIGGPSLSERKRSRLIQALERRLPGVPVDLVDEGRGAVPAARGFEAMRDEVARVSPDLVLWQVGTLDALAGADPEVFGRIIENAAEWLRDRSIDLILIDPPFVPNVGHEPLYWRIVGKIGEVSDRSRINLLRRYAATQHLDNERRKVPGAMSDAGSPPVHHACMPDIVADAIYKAVTR